jgi:serine protease Do
VKGYLANTARAGALLATFIIASSSQAAPSELPDFVRLVRNHAAAVVNISSLQRGRSDDLARHPDALGADDTSLGSGFIVSKDGYILTCAHVVEEAREILVRLADRREFSARLIGLDTRADVALLKIDAGALPTVTFGNPAKLEVGEWVLAIGSPFGFHHSVTSGIVSAKGRSLPQENYIPFIQTDVPINPGNSGGPLFNLRGEVVGINSQIYSRNGGFMGLAFAVPIDIALSISEQIKREGRSRRGWLGVNPQEVTRGLALAYGLDRPRGALIADILPDGPAGHSELRAGDIVIEYGGKPVEHSSDLPLFVSQTAAKVRVKMRVQRRSVGTRDVTVAVGELRDDGPEVPRTDKSRPSLLLADLSDDQRQQSGISHGVMIEGLNLPARQDGLRAGDIVVEMDGKRMTSAAELNRSLANTPAGGYAVLRVRRGVQTVYVAIPSGR